jgi:hypothetical protein
MVIRESVTGKFQNRWKEGKEESLPFHRDHPPGRGPGAGVELPIGPVADEVIEALP